MTFHGFVLIEVLCLFCFLTSSYGVFRVYPRNVKGVITLHLRHIKDMFEVAKDH